MSRPSKYAPEQGNARTRRERPCKPGRWACTPPADQLRRSHPLTATSGPRRPTSHPGNRSRSRAPTRRAGSRLSALPTLRRSARPPGIGLELAVSRGPGEAMRGTRLTVSLLRIRTAMSSRVIQSSAVRGWDIRVLRGGAAARSAACAPDPSGCADPRSRALSAALLPPRRRDPTAPAGDIGRPARGRQPAAAGARGGHLPQQARADRAGATASRTPKASQVRLGG